MNDALWQPHRSRKIHKRLVVEGVLALQTPTALGNGDASDQIDLPLLTDSLDGRPLLTGSSLAGALRAWLTEINREDALLLFGMERGDDAGNQSALIVDDTFGDEDEIEVREGVRLCHKSRTAAQNALYTREAWAAGTTFGLRFELLLCEGDDEDRLRRALATALHAFEIERIALGARKTRGYGRAKVTTWMVNEYDLTTPEGLRAWIYNQSAPIRCEGDIRTALGTEVLPCKEHFFLTAEFWLDGSLLIRSTGRGRFAPDMAHLMARQADKSYRPVLTGTSLAGALRARVAKIANTVGRDGMELTDRLFGPLGGSKQPLKASRVRVWESPVTNGIETLVQFRVSIDRFTGGARDALLFNQQPVFGDAETKITIRVELRHPKHEEIGVLLLLLKDLWTGDLPIGGEASVGRGRLQGIQAIIVHEEAVYKLWDNGNGSLRFSAGAAEALEKYVTAWRQQAL